MSGTAIATGSARGSARRSRGDSTQTASGSLWPTWISAVRSSWRTSSGRGRSPSVTTSASWIRGNSLLVDVRRELGDDVRALVNNAARTEVRSFFEIGVDEWDDVLATNLRGTYLGCRVVGAYLCDRGEGRIVNLSSVAGQACRPSGSRPC